MSPNPPSTPLSTSLSGGSPLTSLTTPMSSGRSSSGNYQQHHPQKVAPIQTNTSGPINHVRKKSFTSGPITYATPSELSPRVAQIGSPMSSPYGSPSKYSSSYMSMISPRKTFSSDMPAGQPKDNYRRSETYTALQARVMQSQNNSVTDLESTRDYPMRQQETTVHDQYSLQSAHQDQGYREKHQRESFYAALPNNHQGDHFNGQIADRSLEEPKQLSRNHSRIASPRLQSGIPQARTKSRTSVPVTPSNEQRSRPTPPPRSRSRTPGGGVGVNLQTTMPTPQQPRIPQQYSGEIQSIHRKSAMMVDDPMTSFIQRPDGQYSSSPSTPSTESETPQPMEKTPIPVADITKHLSGLEFKDPTSQMHLQTELQPSTHLRHPSSNSLMTPQRRSIVFDVPNSTGRLNGSGSGAEGISSPYRTRESSSGSKDSSRKRGKVSRLDSAR